MLFGGCLYISCALPVHWARWFVFSLSLSKNRFSLRDVVIESGLSLRVVVWFVGSSFCGLRSHWVLWGGLIFLLQLFYVILCWFLSVSRGVIRFSSFYWFHGGHWYLWPWPLLPRFQPWENCAWWWSWFKEPPLAPHFLHPPSGLP